jgi:hypothetical protein
VPARRRPESGRFAPALRDEGRRSPLRRPAETIQAIDGTALGIVVIIVGRAKGGDLAVPLTAIGAVQIVVSYVAAFVTWGGTQTPSRGSQVGVEGSVV